MAWLFRSYSKAPEERNRFARTGLPFRRPVSLRRSETCVCALVAINISLRRSERKCGHPEGCRTKTLRSSGARTWDRFIPHKRS